MTPTPRDVELALARLWALGLIEPTPPATGLGPDTIWRYTDLGRELNELLAAPVVCATCGHLAERHSYDRWPYLKQRCDVDGCDCAELDLPADPETLATIQELADNEAEALTLGRVARLARQTYLVNGSEPPRRRWEHPGADESMFGSGQYDHGVQRRPW